MRIQIASPSPPTESLKGQVGDATKKAENGLETGLKYYNTRAQQHTFYSRLIYLRPILLMLAAGFYSLCRCLVHYSVYVV